MPLIEAACKPSKRDLKVSKLTGVSISFAFRRTNDAQWETETIEMTKSLKTERIEARVDPDVRKLIVAAAELQGRSVSEFMVASAKERAEEVLHRQSVIRLTAEDQLRFAEMMLDPPPLNDAMNEALAEHEQFIEPA